MIASGRPKPQPPALAGDASLVFPRVDPVPGAAAQRSVQPGQRGGAPWMLGLKIESDLYRFQTGSKTGAVICFECLFLLKRVLDGAERCLLTGRVCTIPDA